MASAQATRQTGGVLVACWRFLLLATVSVAVWSTGLDGAFQFDDESHILDDAAQQSLKRPAWEHAWSDPRPVVALSVWINHRLDRALGGDGQRPAGYHLWNIAVHTAAALTLFGLFRRSLRRTDPTAPPTADPGGADNAALAVSLLWAVHPLHTQAVTYVIQRSESMMGLCVLLSLYALHRLAQSRQQGDSRARRCVWAAAVVAPVLVGLGCKQVIVVAPLLTLLYDRVFLSRRWREVFAARGLVHVAVALVVLPLLLTHLPMTGPVIARAVQRWSAPLPELSAGDQSTQAPSAGFDMTDLTPAQYAISQPAVLLHYLRLSLWPAGQNVDYGWRVASSIQEELLPVALLLLLLAGAMVMLYRWPRAGFCAVAVFIVLAPTSSVMPIADLAVEHRMYLPLAGLAALAVTGAAALLRRCVEASRAGAVGAALLVAAVLALSLATVQRNRLYSDPVALWRDSAAKAPHHWRSIYNVGMLELRRGRYTQAAQALARAVRLTPEDAMVGMDYAHALAMAGRRDEAVQHYRSLLGEDPKFVRGWVDLGTVLYGQSRLPEARQALQRALRMDESLVDARALLALVLLRLNEFEASEAAFADLEKRGGANADGYTLWGVTLAMQQKHAAAAEKFAKALELNPRHADAAANLRKVREKLNAEASPSSPR